MYACNAGKEAYRKRAFHPAGEGCAFRLRVAHSTEERPFSQH
ncbi:hypothetical protein WCP94_003855 [Bilophila wadsworthia]